MCLENISEFMFKKYKINVPILPHKARPGIICLLADLKVKKIQLEIAEITSCQLQLLQFIFQIINLL